MSRRLTLAFAILIAAFPAAAVEAGIEEITVTATRSQRRELQVPQLVTSVSAEEIQQHGVRTTPEALQEEVGILVQETNLGGGSPFIRGQTGNRLLVLIDGIRLNNSTFRLGPNQYLNTVDAQQIERIEIVRGPSSVLYGSDALGGVVHVITKRRRDFEDGFDIDALARTQFGSAAFEKTFRAEAGANYGAVGFFGGVTFRDFEDLHSGAGEQDHTGYDELDGDARLQVRLADDHEVALTLQRARQDRVPNTVAFTADRAAAFDPQERTLVALTHDWRDLPWGFRAWHTSLSWHDQREVRRTDIFSAMTRTREEDEVGTIGVTSDLEYVVADSHSFIGGIEYYHDDVDSSRLFSQRMTGEQTSERSAFPDGSEYATLGVFLHTEAAMGTLLRPLSEHLNLPWTMMVGGRYSRFSVDSEPPGFGRVDETFDDFTGSIASTYEILDDVLVVGSVAEGFRAPNLEDTVVLRDEPALGTIDSPNPDIEPESVTSYEVGLKAALPQIAGGLFYFYSDYDDLIDRRVVGFRDDDGNGRRDEGEPTISQRRNIGAAEIRGVELWLAVPIRWGLSWQGQLSWIRGDNTTDDEPVRRIPPVMGRTGLLYESERRRFWVELFARVAGEQDRLAAGDRSDSRIPAGGTPGWYTLNLRGGWQPMARLDLNLALENLNDERYRTHGSGIDAPGFNAVGSATVRF